jgi:hypothetical protein
MRVGGPDAPVAVGVIYFAVHPRWRDDDTFAPRLAAVGYAGVEGANLGRPAITATKEGTAFIGVLLTGETTFPTQAVVEVDLVAGPAAVRVPAIAPGVLYPLVPDELWEPRKEGRGYLRGGDYGAACLDESGAAWTAGEWAGGVPSPTCVANEGKDKCPNWSTMVVRSRKAAGAVEEADGAASLTAADRVAAALGGSAPKVGGWGGAPVRGGETPRWLKSAVAEEERWEEEREREREREGRD